MRLNWRDINNYVCFVYKSPVSIRCTFFPSRNLPIYEHTHTHRHTHVQADDLLHRRLNYAGPYPASPMGVGGEFDKMEL